jgi:hypothetical protein
MNEKQIALHQFLGYIMIDAPEFTPLYKEYMKREDSEDPTALLERLGQLLVCAHLESQEVGDLGSRGRNLLNRLINAFERGLQPQEQCLALDVAAALRSALQEVPTPSDVTKLFGPTLTLALSQLDTNTAR